MKSLNLILIVMISMIITSCSNKNGLDPTSVETTALSKTGLSSLDGDLIRSFGHHSGLFAVLDLSDEQRAQIKEILKSRREKFKAIRGQFETRPSFEEIRAKHKEMRESIKKEIHSILTPEQRAKAEELRAQLEKGEIPEQLIDKRIEVLNAKLNLTEEQKSQIKALGFGQTLLSMKAECENPRQFLQKRREFLKGREEKMLSILTPEQQSIFLEMQAQRKDKMRERFQRFGSNRTQKRYERLSAALDLDEKQQERLKEIFTSVRSNLKEELNTSREGRNREELRQAMRERMSEIDEQIQSILNSEQLEKYEALKAARQERRQKRFSDN